MKKILGIVLAALLALGGLGIAEEAKAMTLGGVVIEVAESSILIDTAEFGNVCVNYNETTELEGLEDGFEIGTYVIVAYDGKMTRSLPPQIFAKKISMHVLSGVVIEVREDGGSVLVDQGEKGEVVVHLEEGMAPLFYGCPVDVYFSGVMLMSYPGQVSALHVVTPTLKGTIAEVGDGYLLLDGEDGRQYFVNDDDGTRVDAPLRVGNAVSIYYDGTATESAPPEIYAIAVFTL